ncbi:hypothetical protein PVAP13_5NG274740 [Panicum virgatum]|uniref:Uncharacterized protein n=1 Tax=Panicum virgatum TaxID=38727 RepID=A0A8T0S168_PANVG|nr:hypothetical protein PVAP13_5NG274740 [Panicum virgatum]
MHLHPPLCQSSSFAAAATNLGPFPPSRRALDGASPSPSRCSLASLSPSSGCRLRRSPGADPPRAAAVAEAPPPSPSSRSSTLTPFLPCRTRRRRGGMAAPWGYADGCPPLPVSHRSLDSPPIHGHPKYPPPPFSS